MAIRIVQLGTPRRAGEGLRIGTVRHPPRGVPKAEYAAQDWFDVWFPILAPSAGLVRHFRGGVAPASSWAAFVKKYRAEMARPEASRTLDLLAALSRHGRFSLGCYCADESRCHRSALRALLAERGADVS